MKLSMLWVFLHHVLPHDVWIWWLLRATLALQHGPTVFFNNMALDCILGCCWWEVASGAAVLVVVLGWRWRDRLGQQLLRVRLFCSSTLICKCKDQLVLPSTEFATCFRHGTYCKFTFRHGDNLAQKAWYFEQRCSLDLTLQTVKCIVHDSSPPSHLPDRIQKSTFVSLVKEKR